MKTAVVMGVGPTQGMGASLCRRFAKLGLQVVVAGRTQASLVEVVRSIEAGGGSAVAQLADATLEADTMALFDTAAALGPIAVAIYNAGNNTPGRIDEMSAEYFERSWRICCFGGFLFGREAVRRMQPQGSGTILFTGASASMRGRPNFGAFNSSKAALRAFAQALAKEYGPGGIHVGHVVIDGAIDGEKIRQRFPDMVARLGDGGLIDIEAIVDAYEFLYRQPPRGWSFEVDVRTAVESW